MNRFSVFVVLLPALASAQARATLVDAPLDVRMPVSGAQLEALQSEFHQLLARRSGTLVPTPSAWKAANAALRRQDCDVRDECLRQLAINGSSLYALYASLERNAAGTELTASARVVNQDGELVRGPVKVTVSAAAKDANSNALAQLLAALKLDTLPAVLEKKPAPVVTAPPSTPPSPATNAGPPPPPPPIVVTAPLPETPARPARVASFVVFGLAGAAAITSAGFGLSAAMQRSELPADGRFVSEAQAQQQGRVNGFASVSLGAGIGAGVSLVAAFVLFAVSGPGAVAVAPAIGPSGASATLTWRLP